MHLRLTRALYGTMGKPSPYQTLSNEPVYAAALEKLSTNVKSRENKEINEQEYERIQWIPLLDAAQKDAPLDEVKKAALRDPNDPVFCTLMARLRYFDANPRIKSLTAQWKNERIAYTRNVATKRAAALTIDTLSLPTARAPVDQIMLVYKDILHLDELGSLGHAVETPVPALETSFLIGSPRKP